jgi:hypothetical protein
VRMWCTTGGSMDPVVLAEGDAFRVTPVGRSHYLVTRQRDAVRMGFFRLRKKRPWRVDVVPEPDDPAQAPLLERIGTMAARARLNGWG